MFCGFFWIFLKIYLGIAVKSGEKLENTGSSPAFQGIKSGLRSVYTKNDEKKRGKIVSYVHSNQKRDDIK